jgi:hypothetical protein
VIERRAMHAYASCITPRKAHKTWNYMYVLLLDF